MRVIFRVFSSFAKSMALNRSDLTNYEMAIDPFYIEFARDVIARGTAEVGMHLHAWNSPPTEPLTADDWRHKPYLIEYSDAMMRERSTI